MHTAPSAPAYICTAWLPVTDLRRARLATYNSKLSVPRRSVLLHSMYLNRLAMPWLSPCYAVAVAFLSQGTFGYLQVVSPEVFAELMQAKLDPSSPGTHAFPSTAVLCVCAGAP